MVRPLPPAHADPRKGGPRRQGQGQAGQDEHRRASGDPGPDGHPVDPGGDRLRQRPARRRLHGRGAGEPGHRLHQQADRGHAARRAQHRGNSEGGRSRAGRGRSGRRGADLCRGAGGRCHQYRRACGPGEMLRGHRRDRAGQADAGHGAGIQAQRCRGQGRAGLARSRRAGQVGRSGHRAGTESRRKSARSSGAIRSGDRAQRRRQARGGNASSCSKSSSATANGTRTARASNWCSSSRRGGRPTRPPSRDESGCRPFCFRNRDLRRKRRLSR